MQCDDYLTHPVCFLNIQSLLLTGVHYNSVSSLYVLVTNKKIKQIKKMIPVSFSVIRYTGQQCFYNHGDTVIFRRSEVETSSA